MTEPQQPAPAITGPEVGAWVNHPGATPADLTLVAEVAEAHLDQLLAGRTVPPAVRRLAALDIAADLWDQRTAPNGVRMFTDGLDGTAPVRVRADATARARAILAPWLPPTID